MCHQPGSRRVTLAMSCCWGGLPAAGPGAWPGAGQGHESSARARAGVRDSKGLEAQPYPRPAPSGPALAIFSSSSGCPSSPSLPHPHPSASPGFPARLQQQDRDPGGPPTGHLVIWGVSALSGASSPEVLFSLPSHLQRHCLISL